MTNLCINNISLSNIYIKECNTTYKIYYTLNNIILTGILLKCSGILKEEGDKYKIIIYDDKKIKLIDKLFSETIDDYNSFLFTTDKSTYIEIKKNDIVTTILQNYKNKNIFHLDIKFINKYNNTPIIYII